MTEMTAPLSAAAGAAVVTKRAVTEPPAALPTDVCGSVGAPSTAPVPASADATSVPPAAAKPPSRSENLDVASPAKDCTVNAGTAHDGAASVRAHDPGAE